MDFGIKGKRVLITGAAGGFGKSLAYIFGEEGAIPVIHDRESCKEQLEIICKEIPGCEYVTGDLSDSKQVEELWKNAKDIDILVNSAGIWPTAYVAEMETEDFKKTIDINLIAPFILCRGYVNDRIAKNKKGKIINIVSQAAFHGSTSGHAHYAASKSGLVGFTISLAREVAPYGINVNAVAPGMMRTPMNKEALDKREDEYLTRIPLGRIASPEEVAYSVVFLAGNKSDYVTGATIDVTGGMLMR